MMKLSHESKVRLGVGIGAFVLIIGLVFGISRTLIHFDGPWDLDDVVSGFSGMDDAVDEDDLLDGGNYSAQPQQLSSETFDADAFTSLDLDVTSGTVEVKHVSSGPVRVIESGRVATGTVAFDAATQNLAEIKGSTLKIRQFDCDDERAIDRTVTVELPREVADNMVGITANVGSGDLTVAGIACHDLNLTLDSGDVEFTGTVTDTLNAEVGSGDVTFELYQAITLLNSKDTARKSSLNTLVAPEITLISAYVFRSSRAHSSVRTLRLSFPVHLILSFRSRGHFPHGNALLHR